MNDHFEKHFNEIFSDRERAVKSAVKAIREGGDVEMAVKMAVSIGYQDGINDVAKRIKPLGGEK